MKIVSNPIVTSKYGGNRNISSIGVSGWHNGIDIISKSNDDNLYAIADGKVLFITENDGTGCKTIVTVHHNVLGFGLTLLVLYAHCSGFKKKVNDPIKEGDVIALMGNTGRSTGKHLHCSMYVLTPFEWKSKDNKYYKWNYDTREKYEIDPNTVLHLY